MTISYINEFKETIPFDLDLVSRLDRHQLTDLQLIGRPVRAHPESNFLTALRNCASLRTVHLHGMLHPYLLRAVLNNRYIREIHLQRITLTDEEADIVAQAVRNNKTLKILDLHLGGSATALNKIFKSINFVTSATHLEINFYIQGRDLARIIRDLNLLKHIQAYLSPDNSEEWKTSLKSALLQNRTLQTLTLFSPDNTNFNLPLVKEIFAGITETSALKQIHISNLEPETREFVKGEGPWKAILERNKTEQMDHKTLRVIG